MAESVGPCIDEKVVKYHQETRAGPHQGWKACISPSMETLPGGRGPSPVMKACKVELKESNHQSQIIRIYRETEFRGLNIYPVQLIQLIERERNDNHAKNFDQIKCQRGQGLILGHPEVMGKIIEENPHPSLDGRKQKWTLNITEHKWEQQPLTWVSVIWSDRFIYKCEH